MISNPPLNSLRDKVVQIKQDSLILMKGYPPRQFADHWLYIFTFTIDPGSVVIDVSESEEFSGQRYQVQVGDTILIGDSRYEVLAIEEVDSRLAWVEIDSTLQP